LFFLGEIANAYLKKLGLNEIVALTGSVGKTTVKSFVAEMLTTKYRVHWSKKSFNNEIGVPSTILSCPEDAEILVLEMGARHIGDIAYLCGIAEPTLVCVLNAGEAHLSEFGSRENIVIGKTEIYRCSSSKARLIVNADDPRLVVSAEATGKQMLTFSMKPENKSDYWLEDFAFDTETAGSRVSIGTPDDIVSSETSIYHETLGQNVLASVAIAHSAGLSTTELEEGITRIASEKGRFQVSHLEDRDLILIDDTYNANPTSVKAGIRTLATLLKDGYTEAKVGLILGDMLELGPESENLHKQVMTEALDLIEPTAFIYVGRNYSIGRTLNNSEKIQASCADVDELLDKEGEILDTVLKHCDIIYLKASNAIGLDRVVKSVLDGSR
jgi:UDP-N-acetylmuramoyl-tripeptide--D-alanyl-D-alanine ligase